MQLTNVMNLPDTIADAVAADTYHQDGHISVTGLIQPPRQRQLYERHKDLIVEDVSDRVWMLMGNNVHNILERVNAQDGIQEERLSIDVEGWKVTGQTDLYKDRMITDYKMTSVWAVLHGVKPEWETQVNCYAELFRQAGFGVDGVQIIALLRDWSKNRVQGNYPEKQVVALPVDLWPTEKVQDYLIERVKLHQEAEKLSDADLVMCTPEERWSRPPKWAVKVKGQKRAKRVLDNESDALAWIWNNPSKAKPLEVEYRQGEDVRCESYCPVKQFCNKGE